MNCYGCVCLALFQRYIYVRSYVSVLFMLMWIVMCCFVLCAVVLWFDVALRCSCFAILCMLFVSVRLLVFARSRVVVCCVVRVGLVCVVYCFLLFGVDIVCSCFVGLFSFGRDLFLLFCF